MHKADYCELSPGANNTTHMSAEKFVVIVNTRVSNRKQAVLKACSGG
jgi:hypothetical protein